MRMRVNRSLVHFLAMATAVVYLSDSTGVLAAQRSAISNIRIKNFGCINEDFYRGAQPSEKDYASLASAGVKTVIDLQQEGEGREQEFVEGAGMKFFRIGLSDSSWPSPQKAEEFLKIVNEPANQPVFVHCHGGRHRAGIMTAIYRMTHDGWTADRAYSEMKQYGFESGFGHGSLKDYVYDFYAGLDRVAQKGVAATVSK
ncbi:MAG TPA: dual specificity protein phosphatase family protein [Blastocatellia bacterium]|nr:dual specificity protein phosphatase family protein [Blastocatellia bacterium]